MTKRKKYLYVRCLITPEKLNLFGIKMGSKESHQSLVPPLPGKVSKFPYPCRKVLNLVLTKAAGLSTTPSENFRFAYLLSGTFDFE